MIEKYNVTKCLQNKLLLSSDVLLVIGHLYLIIFLVSNHNLVNAFCVRRERVRKMLMFRCQFGIGNHGPMVYQKQIIGDLRQGDFSMFLFSFSQKKVPLIWPRNTVFSHISLLVCIFKKTLEENINGSFIIIIAGFHF